MYLNTGDETTPRVTGENSFIFCEAPHQVELKSVVHAQTYSVVISYAHYFGIY